MKKLAVTLVGASLAVAMMQAKAEDVGGGFDVSMNAGIVTDYLFRGISQTGTRGAIQGGLDVKHSSGAYVGTWMSSVNFAEVEQDIYGGYGFNVTPDIALDAHVIEYTYPQSRTYNVDYTEYHGGTTISNLAAKGDSLALGADYSNNLQLITNNPMPTNNATWNYSVGYSYPLPMDMTLSATLGHYTFMNDKVFGTKSAYTYWNLGVGKKLVGVNWMLSYNDTNLSSTECNAFTGNNDSCKNELVLAATKSF
jgi:uncharacterized protein (TIGR02001 family)